MSIYSYAFVCVLCMSIHFYTIYDHMHMYIYIYMKQSRFFVPELCGFPVGKSTHLVKPSSPQLITPDEHP